MNTLPADQAAMAMPVDFLPLQGTDYIEFYVGNAKQAAHFYKTAFGFQSLAYAGPETGMKDKVSYVVRQHNITFVFTTSLNPEDHIAYHTNLHGDGVKTIALRVEDARSGWSETIDRGAVSCLSPAMTQDNDGMVRMSGIKTYGQTVHYFIERQNYKGIFLPGFRKWESEYNPSITGLFDVDHCVGNVGWGQMNKWVQFYEKALGFRNILTFDDKDISTEYSALMSKVMSSGNGRIKFPINEPAQGKKRSQVEEYLEFYRGEGVQHIALNTDNMVQTVTKLRSRGVEFLSIPPSYYDSLFERVGEIDENVLFLKELGILVDRDEEGYLLQIFTKPVEDRPTVFFEIIQRRGAVGFGKGNFKALFEAIEREQEKRGNL